MHYIALHRQCVSDFYVPPVALRPDGDCPGHRRDLAAACVQFYEIKLSRENRLLLELMAGRGMRIGGPGDFPGRRAKSQIGWGRDRHKPVQVILFESGGIARGSCGFAGLPQAQTLKEKPCKRLSRKVKSDNAALSDRTGAQRLSARNSDGDLLYFELPA